MNRLIGVLCAFLLNVSTLAVAQNLGTGLYAFGSFDSKGFDSINIGNLNTHFEIPIVTKQGRGLPFNYSVVYDGLIWSATTSTGTGSWQPNGDWGFHGQLIGGFTGYLTSTSYSYSCPTNNPKVEGVGVVMENYVYHDPYGRNHRFNYSYQNCLTSGSGPVITGNGSTSDGSGLSYDGLGLPTGNSDGKIHTRSGAVVVASSGAVGQNSGSITDSNGNTITSNGTGAFTDTLGVTALTIAGSGTPASPLTFSHPVTLQAGGSTSATATVAYKGYTVQTNFQCPGITEYGATRACSHYCKVLLLI
jgi:hypothetical protein